MTDSHHKLSVLGLGLALGVTWGLGMFVLGLMVWWFNWGGLMLEVLGSLYVGFAPTLLGSIIGMLWGFVDCFIAGVVIAWLYNMFTCKHHHHHSS